jgi:hypothetical protein
MGRVRSAWLRAEFRRSQMLFLMNLLACTSEVTAVRESRQSSCDSRGVSRVDIFIVYLFALSAHPAVSKRWGRLPRSFRRTARLCSARGPVPMVPAARVSYQIHAGKSSTTCNIYGTSTKYLYVYPSAEYRCCARGSSLAGSRRRRHRLESPSMTVFLHVSRIA